MCGTLLGTKKLPSDLDYSYLCRGSTLYYIGSEANKPFFERDKKMPSVRHSIPVLDKSLLFTA